MNAPRPYRDQHDVKAMCDLLIEGRKADNGTYYIHPGDLHWWLYYPPLEGDFWDHIHLWDDPDQPGKLLGWALISPDWVGYDVYVQPHLRGTASAQAMYLWAEQQATSIAHARGKTTISSLWVFHDDAVLTDYMQQQGYRLTQGMVHFVRSLERPLPPIVIPTGYYVRACKGLPEVTQRARAQFGAFKSKATFECYLERFSSFMRSPAYQYGKDLVVAAPDGQVGAFCIVWMDETNRVGLFEPVGTNPDFQRQGLGKTIMVEGMRYMKEKGMRTAIVSTYEDNQAAIAFYESMGFQPINRLGTYEKDI